MQLDAVIFDMDGLLIDSETVSAKAFKDTAEEFGVTDSYDIFLSLVGCNENSHKIILEEKLGHRLDAQQFRADWIERYQAILAQGVPPLLPGVIELLEWFKSTPIKMSVATSSGARTAEHKLKGNDIYDYFLSITSGDDVTISKPNPEIYTKAAASINVQPGNAWALEDSENGVRAAVAAGMNVIQVPNLVEPSAELLQLGHTVHSDLPAVLKHLKQLNHAKN